MHGRFLVTVDHFLRFEHVCRAISQDETLYPNANSFCPERFLNPDGTLTDDKVEHAFGYGRRYVLLHPTIIRLSLCIRFCPGKYMARDVVSSRHAHK